MTNGCSHFGRSRDIIVVYHFVVIGGISGFGRECRFQSVSVRKCNEVPRRAGQVQRPVTVRRKI